jgi:hypothetical protein
LGKTRALPVLDTSMIALANRGPLKGNEF